MTSEDDELIERLTRERVTRMYEGDYINPDGPAAASRLTELKEEREWKPIETLPLMKHVLLGSYYDTFHVREGFPPIWEFAEGHAYEFKGVREYSLRRGARLSQEPTHWREVPIAPPYTPSAERLALDEQRAALSTQGKQGDE